MELFKELNNENFILFAAKQYQNRQCQDIEEFYEDLNEFKYVKKLSNRFLKSTDDESTKKIFRLLVNHIIIIYNVFEINGAHRMIHFKLDDEQMEVVKPILLFLNYITEKDFLDIKLNKRAIDHCRKI